MWTVNKPTVTAEYTFATCISRIADAGLKGRMDRAKILVTTASASYDAAAKRTELHLIPQTASIGLIPEAVSVGPGIVSCDEMISLYTGRMAKVGAPGRGIYDELLIAPNDARCPFCGHRDVSTLDHILAKSKFPALTVVPWNLVPCCADCNKAKGDAPPTSKETQFLHPYYDVIENDLWLWCEIVESSPASARFYVKPFSDWDAIMTARVHNQFKRLKIPKLYASQAGRELSNIRRHMQRLFAQRGSEGVREHLEDAYASRAAVHVNSWQTALYRAAVESEWYCNGGFAA
jgi:hypothetical protein